MMKYEDGTFLAQKECYVQRIGTKRIICKNAMYREAYILTLPYLAGLGFKGGISKE